MLPIIVLQQSLVCVTEDRQSHQKIDRYDGLPFWKRANSFRQEPQTPGVQEKGFAFHPLPVGPIDFDAQLLSIEVNLQVVSKPILSLQGKIKNAVCLVYCIKLCTAAADIVQPIIDDGLEWCFGIAHFPCIPVSVPALVEPGESPKRSFKQRQYRVYGSISFSPAHYGATNSCGQKGQSVKVVIRPLRSSWRCAARRVSMSRRSA